MNTKEKEQKNKDLEQKAPNSNMKKLLISLAIVVVVAVLGVVLGVFRGVGDLLLMVKISRNMIVKLVLAMALVYFMSNLCLILLNMFQDKKGRAGTVSTVLSSIVKYVAALLAFCWGLSIIGVNVSTIFASVGIVALIIGFGAESLVADLVTGVFILFENEYNVGDVVEVDGFRGTVKEIGIRTMSLKDAGGNVKIINNSSMKNVINRSCENSVAVCQIGVSYETDLEALEAKLSEIYTEVMRGNEEIFMEGIEYLGVEALLDSSVVLKFKAVVSEKNVFKAQRVMNRGFKIAFDKNGIQIPFPQMDVHTK